jgi:hypothetical protein
MIQRQGDRRQSSWDAGTEEVRQETGDRGQRNGRYGEQRIEDRQIAKSTGNEKKPQTFRNRSSGSKQDENVSIALKNGCQNEFFFFYFVPKFMEVKSKRLGLF